MINNSFGDFYAGKSHDEPFAVPSLLETIKDRREMAIELFGGDLLEQGYLEKKRALLEGLPKDYPRLKADNPELSELATALKYQQEQKLASFGPLGAGEIKDELVHPFMREGTGVFNEISLLDTSSYPPEEKLFWDATKLALRNAQSEIASSDVRTEMESLDTRQLRRSFNKEDRSNKDRGRS